LHRCKHQSLHPCGHQASTGHAAPGGLPRRLTAHLTSVQSNPLLRDCAVGHHSGRSHRRRRLPDRSLNRLIPPICQNRSPFCDSLVHPHPGAGFLRMRLGATASPVGRNTAVADHRGDPGALRRLAIEPPVLLGQNPASRHRVMVAQRRAAVPAAGRVTLHQRDSRTGIRSISESDIDLPSSAEPPPPPRPGPQPSQGGAKSGGLAGGDPLGSDAIGKCSSSMRCCNSSIRLRPSSTNWRPASIRRLSSVSATWSSSARCRSATSPLWAYSTCSRSAAIALSNVRSVWLSSSLSPGGAAPAISRMTS